MNIAWQQCMCVCVCVFVCGVCVCVCVCVCVFACVYAMYFDCTQCLNMSVYTHAHVCVVQTTVY